VRARRNEVAVIAGLRAASQVLEAGAILAERAPATIAFLQIPLTPSRAAALAAFTARAGIDAQSLVLDLLDDVIFDTGFVAYQGEVPCVHHMRSASAKRRKSNDTCDSTLTKLSGPSFQKSQSSAGRTKQRSSSQPSPTQTSAPHGAGSQESTSRQSASCSRPSTKHSGNICGND